MTTRHAGYIVILDDNIREDDAEPVLTALRMVKGVMAVQPVTASYDLVIAKERVDAEWRKRINKLYREGLDAR